MAMFDFELDRRDFVLGSMVAGVLPLGAWAGTAQARQPGIGDRPARLHKLLVDRNIPESVRLGSYAGAIVDEVYVYDGDLTSLLINEIRTQWPKGPRPMAGLTAPGVRIVLEQLGRDHDARIVFSAEHRRMAGGMRHRLVGYDTLLQSPDLRSGGDWVADMAKHIAVCPHQPPSKASSIEYETSVGSHLTDIRSPLVTWVLAPVLPGDQVNDSETVRS
jgi:hypothetical protein